MDDLPSTRNAALLSGSGYYFTGKPCKHGHLSKRYTVSGACCKCQRLINARLAVLHPERNIRNYYAYVERIGREEYNRIKRMKAAALREQRALHPEE